MNTRMMSVLIMSVGIMLAVGIMCQLPPLTPTVVEVVTHEEDTGLLRTDLDKLIHWQAEALPLMVILDEDMSDWEADIEFAVSLWNRVIGSPIFVYGGIEDTSMFPEKPTGGLIVVRKADPNSYPHVQLRYDQESGNLISAPVRLPAGVYSQYRLRTAAHEFGHVLGLGHDEKLPQSVMYPSVHGSENWIVTNSDRDLLLSWYNPDKLVEEHSLVTETSTIPVIETSTTAACDRHCHKTIEFDRGTVLLFH